MTSFVRLSGADNVVTAIKAVNSGILIEDVNTLQSVPTGHKIASCNIKKGQEVIKYGQCIGYAAINIKAGEHVHTHNVEFRNTQTAYEFCTENDPVDFVNPGSVDNFMGFKRDNGSVGTRNYIAIVTSVNCSATAARRIADAFGPKELSEYPNVDGVVAFVHGTGCGMAGDGEGFEALQRVMWGYARHPNHAGVLMVGLGCEMNQIDWLLDAYGLEQGPLFQTMNIQNVTGLGKTIEIGIRKVKEMLPIANLAYREECPVSELKIALQCGGSDAWSGITANPALGKACDILISHGGTGLLAETPEIYGAEHLLTKRSVNQETGEKLVNLIKWWEDYTLRNKGTMDNNPSPGNKKGGLTTILEKSLGASVKGGNTPLMGVYKYAEIVKEKGFTFMDSPGYDPASVTGQIAGGCNIVCFTTGRGSAFGSKPAPTIKLATNTEMYTRMKDDMDINCGDILDGRLSVEEKGKQIYEMIVRVASGEKSKSELQGLGDYEFVPWQIGAVM